MYLIIGYVWVNFPLILKSQHYFSAKKKKIFKSINKIIKIMLIIIDKKQYKRMKKKS